MNRRKRYIIILFNMLLLIGCFTLGVGQLIVRSASVDTRSIIFIGDSRVVGMEKILTDEEKENCYFVAKNKKGLVWLIDEGLDEIKDIIAEHENEKFDLVFMLGVNDLKNLNRYLKYYNETIVDEFQDQNLYVVSVNPVIEKVLIEHGYKKRTTKSIEKFNDLMKEKLKKNIKYLDTYSILMEKEGFGMIDGLHYMPYTYERIFINIKDMIKELD